MDFSKRPLLFLSYSSGFVLNLLYNDLMIRNYTAITAKLFFLSLILGIISPLFASGPRMAVLTPENRTNDPRYDYVGAIINGIVLYDLSTAGSVEIVDRSALDDALRERELSLSALAINPSKLSEGIVGADYILTGEYVLLGEDLRLTLKLVDTATTRVITFADYAEPIG